MCTVSLSLPAGWPGDRARVPDPSTAERAGWGHDGPGRGPPAAGAGAAFTRGPEERAGPLLPGASHGSRALRTRSGQTSDDRQLQRTPGQFIMHSWLAQNALRVSSYCNPG